LTFRSSRSQREILRKKEGRTCTELRILFPLLLLVFYGWVLQQSNFPYNSQSRESLGKEWNNDGGWKNPSLPFDREVEREIIHVSKQQQLYNWWISSSWKQVISFLFDSFTSRNARDPVLLSQSFG
jgi:hypothetical protein